MEIHTITEIPKLLINIKGLRGHVDNYLVMALKFEEITDLRLKNLIIPVIPNHAHLIQKQERMRGRDIVAQMLNIKEPDTRDTAFLHISINKPAPFKILRSHFDKKGTFATPLLTEHQKELIGIQILFGPNMPYEKQDEEAAKNFQTLNKKIQREITSK